MISKEDIHPGLFQSMSKLAGFCEAEFDLFCNFLKVVRLERKEYLLSPGQVCRLFAYVNKGCFRRFILDDHSKEIVVNFAIEDWWIGDLDSLFNRTPSIYYIQALEPSMLLTLNKSDFDCACEKIPKFKLFHDRKMQRNHYAALKRLTVAKSGTPEERYLMLMDEQPGLFQRVPLHYIASYLGIEPESLSRLRKRLTDKSRKS